LLSSIFQSEFSIPKKIVQYPNNVALISILQTVRQLTKSSGCGLVE